MNESVQRFIDKNMAFIIFGAIGFVISFLAALASGASALMILLRPLISALIWVGALFAVKFVLFRFVPDLHNAIFNSDAAQSQTVSHTQKGNNLDVSIGDDDLDGETSRSKMPSGAGEFDDISFDSVPEGEEQVGRADISMFDGAKAVPDNLKFDQEPKTMVKALRTIITRTDKEGI